MCLNVQFNLNNLLNLNFLSSYSLVQRLVGSYSFFKDFGFSNSLAPLPSSLQRYFCNHHCANVPQVPFLSVLSFTTIYFLCLPLFSGYMRNDHMERYLSSAIPKIFSRNMSFRESNFVKVVDRQPAY